MTPLQIAHAHCANWRKDNDRCLDAIIDDDLQIRRCLPKPKCVLGTPGQRCAYFEECLLPMGRSIHDPAYRQQFEEAIRQYRLAVNLPSPEKRPCPTCNRGMEPRRRFCPVCAAVKRRASTRAAFRKHWLASKQLTQNAPLAGKGLRGHFEGVGMETADTPETAVNCPH